ncbi:hypothetical protein ACM66Z_08840 [Sulfurovum sp. ST-21]|nr:hypothetical protein [Sulfurovum indicum]
MAAFLPVLFLEDALFVVRLAVLDLDFEVLLLFFEEGAILFRLFEVVAL